MQIEESELKELLNKKSKSVESKKFPFEALLSLFAFIFSALMAQIFTQKLGLKIAFWTVVFLNICYEIYLLSRFVKTKYSSDDFIKDIQNSSKVRNFSLIVLKDKSGTFLDGYLLRYDRRWKCYLLPYRQTHEANDEKFILDYVNNVLKLNSAEIKDIKIDDIEKYSVSDQITKNYHHTFYLVEFDAKASGLKECNLINKEKFKWFTIDQMKRNKSIESKNSETVNFIARNF